MLKKDYISAYNKKNYQSVLLRIPNNNKEIIEKLKSVPSKNGYLLELVQNDINPPVLKLSFIKKVLKDVLGKHNIKKIYLFGSYSRGEATKGSDVDILCEKGDINTLLQKEYLEEELEKELGKKVDLLFLTTQMPAFFKNKIEEDLIELF